MNNATMTKTTEFETLWAAYVADAGRFEDHQATHPGVGGFKTSNERKGWGLRSGKLRRTAQRSESKLREWCRANGETLPGCINANYAIGEVA